MGGFKNPREGLLYMHNF